MTISTAITGPASVLMLFLVGAPITVVGGIVCHNVISAIASLAKVYSDPPLGRFGVVARLDAAAVPTLHPPPCPASPASTRRLCTSIQAAIVSWAASATRLQAVARALATTVGRESGATRAGDKADIARQRAAELAMLPNLEQAAQADRAAATHLAKLITASGVRLMLSNSQSARLISSLRSNLAAAGLSGSALARVAGSFFTPAPTDVLAAIEGRPSTLKPTITSVSFSGTPASPTISIHGTNLGTNSAPDPARHPAGQNGCPSIGGDMGYDYGTSLYLAVPAKNWAAGRYRPALNETDCIDIVTTKFTQSEVQFHFGVFYTSTYPKFALTSGSKVEIAVNGATFSTTVKYT